MTSIDKVLDAFLTGDYLVIFLIVVLILIIILIVALLRAKDETIIIQEKYDDINEELEEEKTDDDFLDSLDLLRATSEDDIIDENEPLIKQVKIPEIKTYDDIINEYETSEEEDAIISASDLEQKTKERMQQLGTTDSKMAIEKYEEEQENKAIISYEQLLKNAQNITLTYKEEKNELNDAPKINKVEIEQKKVTEPENFLEEEEFLKILKSFRMSL